MAAYLSSAFCTLGALALIFDANRRFSQSCRAQTLDFKSVIHFQQSMFMALMLFMGSMYFLIVGHFDLVEYKIDLLHSHSLLPK